ncbi:MAG: hypothetical protein LAO78_22585 [Acidobacteriia bacterium]|nr:hypothetical protein [Terriglobia bacterium]
MEILLPGRFVRVCVRNGTPNMRAAGKGQLESSKLVRFIALSCILLALVMTGVEATHAHSEAAISRNSSPCAICLSAHAKAPTFTVQLLPLIYAVETVAVTYESQGKSAALDLSLFIRPPPSV